MAWLTAQLRHWWQEHVLSSSTDGAALSASYITESHLQQNVFGHLSCVHRLWKALALLGTQHGRSSAGDSEMYFARLSEQPHTLIHLQKHNCAWGKWSAAMFLSGLQRKPKVVLVTHVMELTHNGRICHPWHTLFPNTESSCPGQCSTAVTTQPLSSQLEHHADAGESVQCHCPAQDGTTGAAPHTCAGWQPQQQAPLPTESGNKKS